MNAVLDPARYGDVMFALEQRSGSVVTYIAEVHRDHATRLAALDEPEGITRLGNGTVRFTSPAVAHLRSLRNVSTAASTARTESGSRASRTR
ncbi:hypothetical protein [Streptomyces mirabilis]|jgi:hypothetical protein|uniref:hypothetical protein n=1 Tax=Streptomyces mirabilis TaxID=68239 RepID=UPI0009431884|nr:hypothetical protein [Streptomyces mirabilis]